MKTLFFDVVSGASGDMILSSLIDIGVPLDYLRTQFAKLAIPGFTIDIEKQKRSGITASHLKLSWDSPKVYRHIYQIQSLIESAQFAKRVVDRCNKVLLRIGEAEAKVHGIPVDKVHFHEIGAVDTIVDIAGICLSLEYLEIDEIVFSSLTDGNGTVTTEHGIMPVPVPAVAEMLAGFAFHTLDVQAELLTPTGCAVLTALGRQDVHGMSGTVQKTGYGCGTKILEKTPNVLRVFLLESYMSTTPESVCVMESDMDHISGEIMGDVANRLLQNGALDVSWSPVFMKKGRPGYRLTVLCTTEKKQDMADFVILHTRTLGVRCYTADRIIAERQALSSGTFHGETINEKKCFFKNHSFTKPEYDSLAKISNRTGVPIIELTEEYLRTRSY